MAAPLHDIPVRSARDQLIDLLAIGDSFPLTDLNVVADQLKVAFGGTAKIPIENAQAGMRYQLCSPKGQTLGTAFQALGQGDTLVIETPPVNDDLTYRIQVEKLANKTALPPQGPRFLDETAPVKVGIDTALAIELLVAAPADPTQPRTRLDDARAVPWGSSVDVRVHKSQEGVEYWLVLGDGEPKDVVRMGDLGPLLLPTGPVHEDMVIRVRASKTFLLSESRLPETVLLDTRLFLKVMANPGLAVDLQPAPILEHRQDAAIRIAASQASVQYRLFMRAIPDADYLRGNTKDQAFVSVAVPGQPDVQVRRPPPFSPWQTPEGWRPVAEDALPGTGAELLLPAPGLAEDALFMVQASKLHRLKPDDPDSATFGSAVALDLAAAALVRPDAERVLQLRVPLQDGKTGSSLQVAEGQRGVYYHLRPLSADAAFSWPAYFHKRDPDDARQNKGVGQLAIEIDFAIATDAEVAPATRAASPFPRAPVLDILPFPGDDSLDFRAVKAQTGLDTRMSRQALVAAVPAIVAEQEPVDFGSPATLLVPASNAADHYQLLQDGAAAPPAQDGDGSDLKLTSAALHADALLQVLIRRADDKGMGVERVFSLAVRVRPDPGLTLALRSESVAAGAGTELLVQASQEGVLYQLLAGKAAVGAALAGTGAEIALPTGPIEADTVFSVMATRADDARVAVMLATQATLKLAPGS